MTLTPKQWAELVAILTPCPWIAIVNLLAIVLGPVIAVSITLWWQKRWEQRKGKYDAKLKLFLTLMADRKSNPETYEWVRALNLIDVVFEDNENITKLWHELYELYNSNSPSTPETRDNKLVELLDAMGKQLGFKNVQQLSIAKFHCPKAHVQQMKMNADTQAELLRVLKNTSSIWIEPEKKDEKASDA